MVIRQEVPYSIADIVRKSFNVVKGAYNRIVHREGDRQGSAYQYFLREFSKLGKSQNVTQSQRKQIDELRKVYSLKLENLKKSY